MQARRRRFDRREGNGRGRGFGFLVHGWLQAGASAIEYSTNVLGSQGKCSASDLLVLDLSFFLPAVVVTGVLLLRQKPLGYTLAPAFVVFLVLTGVPILITLAVQQARFGSAVWGVVVPIGALTLVLLGLLGWLLSAIQL